MRKRILALLLCWVLLVSFCVPVFATEADETQNAEETETVEEVVREKLTISNAEEFLVFAENCRLDIQM